jgi:hypothetical protein
MDQRKSHSMNIEAQTYDALIIAAALSKADIIRIA